MGHRRADFRNARFNTQPPKGGWMWTNTTDTVLKRFNTQPPKGGWSVLYFCLGFVIGFNTQPPKGGWVGCMIFK